MRVKKLNDFLKNIGFPNTKCLCSDENKETFDEEIKILIGADHLKKIPLIKCNETNRKIQNNA